MNPNSQAAGQMATFRFTNDPNPLTIAPNVTVPDENKPNLTNISDLVSIPIIDMTTNNEAVVDEIRRACEEFGVFQVINHGIPKQLCQDVLDVITNFFNLPRQEKACMLSTDQHMEVGKIFRYFINDPKTQQKIFMWGEAFFHTWHPVDHATFIDNLPTCPPSYREVVSEYVKHVASLITKLLSFISQALNLDQDYLAKRLGENPKRTAQANYYPPCPDPERTLGLRDHTDLNILTVLLQEEGVTGLHILKDDEWFAVAPMPGALVVNVADQLQVLSNDKFKSVRHRAVNHQTKSRASFAVFIGPQGTDEVGPIEKLIENDPPAYRKYTFGDYMKEWRKQAGKSRKVKEVFKIESDGTEENIKEPTSLDENASYA